MQLTSARIALRFILAHFTLHVVLSSCVGGLCAQNRLLRAHFFPG